MKIRATKNAIKHFSTKNMINETKKMYNAVLHTMN